MAKPEWGRKRTCQVCGKKYYDFNKSPVICPSCGAKFDTDLFLRTKKIKIASSKVTEGNKQENYKTNAPKKTDYLNSFSGQKNENKLWVSNLEAPKL